jgi:hypothetical protein
VAKGFLFEDNVVVNLTLWVIKHEGHLNCVLKIDGYLYLKGRFHHWCAYELLERGFKLCEQHNANEKVSNM